MAAGDRYKLTHNYIAMGQNMANVYVYEQNEGGGSAEELAAAWLTDVFPDIRQIQNEAAVTQDIEVINLDNDDDFHTLPCTVGCDGVQTGDVMPPYVSWAFRLNRASRASRHGQKRIGGVNETHVAAGVATAGFLPTLNATADAIEATLSDGFGNEWELRIPRFGPTGELVQVFPISSVDYVRVSTQNSRKFGHGS